MFRAEGHLEPLSPGRPVTSIAGVWPTLPIGGGNSIVLSLTESHVLESREPKVLGIMHLNLKP